jgi:hypothetical protein
MLAPPFVIFEKESRPFAAQESTFTRQPNRPRIPNVTPSVKRQGIKNGVEERGWELLNFVCHDEALIMIVSLWG